MTNGFNRRTVTWRMQSDPGHDGAGFENANTRVHENVHPLGGHEIEVPAQTADRLSEFYPPTPGSKAHTILSLLQVVDHR